MEIVADLQLHSHYSRAVSKYMNLEEINRYASRKGIDLVTVTDWQHPLWFKELTGKLKEESLGVYQLRTPPQGSERAVYYLLVSEVSCVYRQAGKGRRIHYLVFSPSLETCEKVIKGLQKLGQNIMSDGRPIVNLSS